MEPLGLGVEMGGAIKVTSKFAHLGYQLGVEFKGPVGHWSTLVADDGRPAHPNARGEARTQ
ncbi:hypothetical protein GCM10009638_22360 [Luteococcus sanguinis]